MKQRNMIEIVAFMKSKTGINQDKEIEEILQIPNNNLSNMKKRNQIPYEKIMQWCRKNNITLESVFSPHDGYGITLEMVTDPIALKHLYWTKEIPVEQIAKEINMSKGWVQKQITKFNLGKKENGIPLRGKKGYKMPPHERVKHQSNTAKNVLKISLVTGNVIHRYMSMHEAIKDGFRRDRIHEVNKGTLHSHKGYSWRIEEIGQTRGNQ